MRPNRRLRKLPRALSLAVACVLSTCSVLATAPTSAAAEDDTFAVWLRGVADDVNAYWLDSFTRAGLRYVSPSVVVFGPRPIDSACGTLSVYSGPRYCAPERRVYLDEAFLWNRYQTLGDFAAAIVVAHEVGHHVQNLLGLGAPTTIQMELNADCLSGMWSAYVAYQGRLDPGDVQESLFGTMEAGDPVGVPWYAPGAHGSTSQRAEWLLHGFAAATISDCYT